jgi:hypothetical protein
MFRLVLFFVSLGGWAIRAVFLSRSELVAENLALRQQVCALKRERPRPPLDNVDLAFWVARPRVGGLQHRYEWREAA